jgi:hypothetical protein
VEFKPFGELRWLPWFVLAAVLLMMMVYRQEFERVTSSKRMVLGGALSAMAAFAGLNMAGCGGGSAEVTLPPIITPTGTSTIVLRQQRCLRRGSRCNCSQYRRR